MAKQGSVEYNVVSFEHLKGVVKLCNGADLLVVLMNYILINNDGSSTKSE